MLNAHEMCELWEFRTIVFLVNFLTPNRKMALKTHLDYSLPVP